MMLRHPPTFGYSGLTIVMSNPSRNDLKVQPQALLSGVAGWVFDTECLAPYLNRGQCDIRLADDPAPLLPGTKCVLLLGQYAHSLFTGKKTTLDEQRGSPMIIRGMPTISSYMPQDCLDMVDHESRHNPAHKTVADLEDTHLASEILESKDKERTQRPNYRFWLRADTQKICKILLQHNGVVPFHKKPDIRLWPNATHVIEALREVKNDFFYFDMETDFISADMRCFGFSFGSKPDVVWVVPVINTDYKPAYDRIGEIFLALLYAIEHNNIVSHNGAHFDFLILAIRYLIGVRRVYDTMVSQNRCLHEDSPIDTVNGQVPIKNLVGKTDFHVWSFKNGKPYPVKVKRVWKIGNEKIVRVHYWKSAYRDERNFRYYIDCTPDHKFLLKTGEWEEAQHLKGNDRLESLKLCYNYNEREYHTVRVEKFRVEKSHRYIYETLLGPIPKGWVVHHKDENKHNNEPTNLMTMGRRSHRAYHSIGNSYSIGRVPHNKGKGKIESYKKKEIELLYNSGMSQKKIAIQLGTDSGTISRLMAKFGLVKRTLKAAQQIRRQSESNARVIQVENLNVTSDVYCMEVEETNSFSCNGVIVHNCFPTLEKSLGHCIALETFEEYHKDKAAHGYHNNQQAEQLYGYCGLDVFAMRLVHLAQIERAKLDPGLAASIELANRSIVPYLTNSILGMHYREEDRVKWLKHSDRLLTQYMKVMQALHGPGVLPLISNQKCVKYFHEQLGYKVVDKSDKTGNPSLAEDNLLKLALQHNNPIISFLIKYRQKMKESGTLKFTPWR